MLIIVLRVRCNAEFVHIQLCTNSLEFDKQEMPPGFESLRGFNHLIDPHVEFDTKLIFFKENPIFM